MERMPKLCLLIRLRPSSLSTPTGASPGSRVSAGAGVVWLYSIVFYFPLDLIKFFIRFVLSGRAWDNLLENKVGLFLSQ